MEKETLDLEKLLQDTQDGLVSVLTRDFKKIDFSAIARKIASGELMDAYISALNMEADFIGCGGKYTSEEHKEIKRSIQYCEHWIARSVLKEAGCKEISIVRYVRTGEG